jgi:hypothetical protein
VQFLVKILCRNQQDGKAPDPYQVVLYLTAPFPRFSTSLSPLTNTFIAGVAKEVARLLLERKKEERDSFYE